MCRKRLCHLVLLYEAACKVKREHAVLIQAANSNTWTSLLSLLQLILWLQWVTDYWGLQLWHVCAVPFVNSPHFLSELSSCSGASCLGATPPLRRLTDGWQMASDFRQPVNHSSTGWGMQQIQFRMVDFRWLEFIFSTRQTESHQL